MNKNVIFKQNNSDVNCQEQSLIINGRFKGQGQIVAILFMENQCCKDRPVMIYAHNGCYGCDCACGSWCTSGKKTPEEAVEEYREMNYQYTKEKEYIEKYGFGSFLEYAYWNGTEYINTDPDMRQLVDGDQKN